MREKDLVAFRNVETEKMRLGQTEIFEDLRNQ